jgi:hypothetical protein
MTSGADMAIESLRTELDSVRLKISDYRKRGFDTKIAELKVMNLPYKIKFAEASQSIIDIEKANVILSSVNEELKEIENQSTEDLNKDAIKQVEEYKTFIEKKESGEIYKDYSQSKIMKTTEQLIVDANENLDNNRYEEALHNYLELREIYKYLPMELKKPVYYDTINIYKRILNSGIIKISSAKESKGNSKINMFQRLFEFIRR